MSDWHRREVELQESVADTWNEHVRVGQFVVVRMRSGALVKSRVLSAASVGVLALEAGVAVAGLGWMPLKRIKRKGQP